MKQFHSFYERHHRFHQKIKPKCEFCAALTGVYQDDSPLILAPIQLFKKNNSITFKPPMNKSPSKSGTSEGTSEGGNEEKKPDDGTVAGYTPQEVNRRRRRRRRRKRRKLGRRGRARERYRKQQRERESFPQCKVCNYVYSCVCEQKISNDEFAIRHCQYVLSKFFYSPL